MKKFAKRLGITLGVIVGILLAFVLVMNLIQPLLYSGFYAEAKAEFGNAGLFDGMVPQGMTYVEKEDLFLQCGYMADGKSPSRIYICKDGSTSYVELFDKDGNAYSSHTGGMAVGEKYVWLANDGDGSDNCVWTIELDEILNGDGKITRDTCIYPESRSACVTVYDGMLWTGEFYDPEKYPTKETHHLTTGSGEENPAFLCGYRIDESTETGVASDVPEKILSVRDKLQGIVFDDTGKAALSTSYGFSNSHIYVYENVLTDAADTSVMIDGNEIPVWFLDEDALIRDVEMMPMSEDLEILDGRLYIQGESCCLKYYFGWLFRAWDVYSIPLA